MPIDRNSAQYITGATYKPTQTSAPGVWDLDDQANNIAKNLWPLPPSAITRSLRINQSDSAYLNRTFTTAGNRKLWTYSLWAKKNNLTATSTLISARTGNNDDYAFFYWSSTGNLYFLQGRVGANDDIRTSVPVFRDPSAWYHFVIIYDSDNSVGADRIQTYVNGSKVTWSIGTGPMAQGFSSGWVNYNGAHEIGRKTNYQTDYSSDFMIAEVNFVDGQSVAATNFAETDPQTGVWIPKRYSGTYGTNGFRLSFANNSSTTALGYDSSGQGNNWTANNFSVTPGVNNDVLLDVPSLYGTDTGLGGEVLGNYCTGNWTNSNDPSGYLTDGGLRWGVDNTRVITGTFAMLEGKWYCEATPFAIITALEIGIIATSIPWTSSNFNSPGSYAAGYTYLSGGNKYNNNSSTSYGASYTTNDVIGIAFDADARTITFYKNGVSQGIAFSSITAGPYFICARATGIGSAGFILNFGQRPFTYAAPSGFKALCTTNLPAPAIGQTSSNQADNHFAIATYLGNGTSVTVSGLKFSPDFVWMKARNGAYQHGLFDRLRGNGIGLVSNSGTVGETSYSACTFTNDGFINGTDYNGSGTTYVAWCWNAGGTSVTNSAGTNGATIASTYRANRAAGFSIVTYTGNGVDGATVAHGLGTAPAFIIVKSRSNAFNWGVWHKNLAKYDANHAYALGLNLTRIADATSQYAVFYPGLNNTNVFGLGNESTSNQLNSTYVVYCFAEVSGYSAFGSFSHAASADGTFVYTGFRPRFLLLKGTDNASNWMITDSTRDPTNFVGRELVANLTNTEASPNSLYSLDFVSNGFKMRNTGLNGNFIYMAIAETPARLSTAR